MTIEQAAITWAAAIAGTVAAAVGAYFLLLLWIDRRATKRGLQRAQAAAQARWDNTIHFARWDMQIDGTDYADALKTELKREYRRIPDDTDLEAQR